MSTESEPRRYRKLPVVIMAVRWTGDNTERVQEFLGASNIGVLEGRIGVVSHEGLMWGSVGVWVLRGIAGEHYLCDDMIFRRTYVAAEDEA